MSTVEPTHGTTRAAVLHSPKDLRIEEVPLPPPGPEELQIAIRSTTLCGSDLHYYNHFRNGDIISREPLALGHESSGIVVARGSALDPAVWPVGTRVALEVGLPCGACARCLEGRYNICASLRFRSSCKSFPHFWGTLQERINHPAKWCHKLPAGVSLSAGALLEPLGVALHCTDRARKNGALKAGCTVIVFGAGAVGMLVAAVCMLQGAARVLVADVIEGRLNNLLRLKWCTHIYNSPRQMPGSSTLEKLEFVKETAGGILKHLDKPEGADVVFECTGVEACVQMGIYAARPGGALVLVGMGTPVMTLPISAAALREVDILGGFRYANTYPAGIEILKMGKLEILSGIVQERDNLELDEPPAKKEAALEKIITQKYYGMQGVKDAFEMAGKGADHLGGLVVKVEVVFPQEEDVAEAREGTFWSRQVPVGSS
ncbi:chaperonin 10-like protein [Sphaerosporella brunnea]|uniref:Chaperonin 10-like protein n=1 Tax=Sphaerosporella brunnea TaxID=1250544 RepID=A0A5J5F1K9_9PEZI|nr:chaperonin 10-like protein [Sphaerosporella brunnea]